MGVRVGRARTSSAAPLSRAQCKWKLERQLLTWQPSVAPLAPQILHLSMRPRRTASVSGSSCPCALMNTCRRWKMGSWCSLQGSVRATCGFWRGQRRWVAYPQMGVLGMPQERATPLGRLRQAARPHTASPHNQCEQPKQRRVPRQRPSRCHAQAWPRARVLPGRHTSLAGHGSR